MALKKKAMVKGGKLDKHGRPNSSTPSGWDKEHPSLEAVAAAAASSAAAVTGTKRKAEDSSDDAAGSSDEKKEKKKKKKKKKKLRNKYLHTRITTKNFNKRN